jgi:hypothetical protein
MPDIVISCFLLLISLPWCHEFVIMMMDYYGMAAILSLIVNKISDSQTHNASQTNLANRPAAMPAGTPTKF